MRYRPRVLLIVLVVGMGGVLGAIYGALASQHHISDAWLPSRDNLLTAAIWGATIGFFASACCAAILVDTDSDQSQVWWIVPVIVGAFCGATYFLFAVTTAAV